MAVMDKMPPEVLAKVEQRQAANGFTDIDGLQDYIREIWPDYDKGRATTGGINKSLKQTYRDARRRALYNSAFLDVIGEDKIYDTALVTAMMLDGITQDAVQTIMDTADAGKPLSEEQLAIYDLVTKGLQRSASVKHQISAPRTKEKDKAAAKTGQSSSDVVRQQLIAKMAAMLDKAKPHDE